MDTVGAEALSEEGLELSMLCLLFQVLVLLICVTAISNFDDVKGGEGGTLESVPSFGGGGSPGWGGEALDDENVRAHLGTLLVRQSWQH